MTSLIGFFLPPKCFLSDISVNAKAKAKFCGKREITLVGNICFRDLMENILTE